MLDANLKCLDLSQLCSPFCEPSFCPGPLNLKKESEDLFLAPQGP